MIVTEAKAPVVFRLERKAGVWAHGVTFPSGRTVLDVVVAPAHTEEYATAALMRAARVTTTTRYVTP